MITVPITTQDRVPMPIHVSARPAQASAAVSLSDVIRILKQRFFLILFIFLFFIGAAVGLTLWLFKNYPLYNSSAAVMVESSTPKDPTQFTEEMLQADLLNRLVADQMFMVKDEGLLREVLGDQDVRDTTGYR